MHRPVHEALKMTRRRCARSHPQPPRRTSRGFTLIEVLVTIIIMAVSVLGLAAMLGRVNTYAHGALLRTDATIVLTDMAERIMANRANVRATPGDYTVGSGDALDCATAPTAVAALDLWQFRCMAKLSLPGGSGSVAPDDAAAPTQVIVRVTWDDSRGGMGRSEQTLSQVVNLR
jgi:type IV pilus assembly protein PilV